jgi:hypothetical protein
MHLYLAPEYQLGSRNSETQSASLDFFTTCAMVWKVGHTTQEFKSIIAKIFTIYFIKRQSCSDIVFISLRKI